MKLEEQVACEFSEGVVTATLTGEFDQPRLLEAIGYCQEFARQHGSNKFLILRVDAPHSALSSYEHIFALQAEAPPREFRVAFLARTPEDFETMKLLAALIQQLRVLQAEVFCDEATARTWLNT